MLCRYPYMIGTFPAPCGGTHRSQDGSTLTCLPCRINRRRLWAHRILLESYKHGDSCFVTLTYDEDHVPDSLVKADYQNWLKRLRKTLAPKKIRYFIAGEYGDITHRPHFHAAIFGLDPIAAGGLSGRSGIVETSWGNGFTYVGNLTWKSASYIAGYLTKKVVTDGENSVRAFSRMSLRPGIGRLAITDIAKSIWNSSTGLGDSLDVPTVLRYGTRLLPLGRYLRRELRGELGFASKDTPSEASRLHCLSEASKKIEQRAQLKAQGYSCWDAQNLVIDIRNQKLHNQENRFLIHDSKRRLV